MTPRYLLNTNIVAEPLRPRPDERILAQLKGHQDEIVTAAVVWHELWFGCYRLPPSARRTAIEQYLVQVVGPGLAILPYGQAAANWHAAERARLVAVGKTPPFSDGMIAAIAAANHLVLVTLNLDGFRPFQGLQLESWQD